MCLIQTTSALPQLAVYLIEVKGLNFVLLGYVNSNPIERRFGVYRQSVGGNYYMALRQFLESEKKLRVKFLVKFCKMSFKDIREVFKGIEDPEMEKQLDKDVDEMIVALSEITFSDEFSVEK